MPTKSQIDAMNLYAALMEEIKVRIAAINAGTLGKLSIPAPIVKEFCFLQLRMVCELIALACITAHGDLNQTQKLRKEWAADKIIEELEKLHPEFFPVQALSKTTEFGYEASRVVGCMTKEELVALYHKCGDVLHKGSIRKLLKARMPAQVDYPDITKWAQRIVDLLGNHVTTTLGGELAFFCMMHVTSLGGRVQVAITEAMTPSESAEIDAKYPAPR